MKYKKVAEKNELFRSMLSNKQRQSQNKKLKKLLAVPSPAFL
jgi:hypothetical protein